MSIGRICISQNLLVRLWKIPLRKNLKKNLLLYDDTIQRSSLYLLLLFFIFWQKILFLQKINFSYIIVFTISCDQVWLYERVSISNKKETVLYIEYKHKVKIHQKKRKKKCSKIKMEGSFIVRSTNEFISVFFLTNSVCFIFGFPLYFEPENEREKKKKKFNKSIVQLLNLQWQLIFLLKFNAFLFSHKMIVFLNNKWLWRQPSTS